jgi:hypothetical protein
VCESEGVKLLLYGSYDGCEKGKYPNYPATIMRRASGASTPNPRINGDQGGLAEPRLGPLGLNFGLWTPWTLLCPFLGVLG